MANDRVAGAWSSYVVGLFFFVRLGGVYILRGTGLIVGSRGDGSILGRGATVFDFLEIIDD